MMTRRHAGVIAAGLVTILYGVSPASAQTVGTASSFAIVGGTTVTAGGATSVINGDVGVSPGTSITGFPAPASTTPPYSVHSNDAAAISAQAATLALYNSLAATGGATPIGAGLSGTTRTPGVYSVGAADLAAGGTFTLNGAGVYVFQVASSLTANVGSQVLLINGANACNVYWQVTSAATLNGVTFAGNVVAQANVTLGVGDSLTGRALATSRFDHPVRWQHRRRLQHHRGSANSNSDPDSDTHPAAECLCDNRAGSLHHQDPRQPVRRRLERHLLDCFGEQRHHERRTDHGDRYAAGHRRVRFCRRDRVDMYCCRSGRHMYDGIQPSGHHYRDGYTRRQRCASGDQQCGSLRRRRLRCEQQRGDRRRGCRDGRADPLALGIGRAGRIARRRRGRDTAPPFRGLTSTGPICLEPARC